MKKQIITILLAGMLLIAATGCSGKGSEAPADTGSNTESTAAVAEDTSLPSDANELEGTIDEVKDSMFVVEATDGTYYAFNFGDNVPATKDDLTPGEKVKIYYSGEISEVEAFTGTIYKIEKM